MARTTKAAPAPAKAAKAPVRGRPCPPRRSPHQEGGSAGEEGGAPQRPPRPLRPPRPPAKKAAPAEKAPAATEAPARKAAPAKKGRSRPSRRRSSRRSTPFPQEQALLRATYTKQFKSLRGQAASTTSSGRVTLDEESGEGDTGARPRTNVALSEGARQARWRSTTARSARLTLGTYGIRAVRATESPRSASRPYRVGRGQGGVQEQGSPEHWPRVAHAP